MQEAIDFRDECNALAAILENAADADFSRATLFKDWTLEDIIGHLYLWNRAAGMTLENREKFQAFFVFVATHMGKGESHPEMQRRWLDENEHGIRGKALFDAWRAHYPLLADAYHGADPQLRVAWAGPDMSAQSKIIARQMETWAHGQAIFDVLGMDRHDTDRIRNIAHLGVTTYSWAFRNRGEDPPSPKPFIELSAPSGAVWAWTDQQADNAVRGSAVEFCQVVTQTRNIGDTAIALTGPTAVKWMSIAQCFAGLPNPPPAKGARYKAS
jgi:uncharacterized protein (TIGR03084 family)